MYCTHCGDKFSTTKDEKGVTHWHCKRCDAGRIDRMLAELSELIINQFDEQEALERLHEANKAKKAGPWQKGKPPEDGVYIYKRKDDDGVIFYAVIDSRFVERSEYSKGVIAWMEIPGYGEDER